MLPLHLLIAALFGLLERENRHVIEFLREENRVLRAQLHDGGCGCTTTNAGGSPPSDDASAAGCSQTLPRS